VADPKLDALSLAYLGMAEQIVGRELKLPRIGQDWREQVRLRLEPKFMNVGYVRDLESADPTRAAEELDRYISAALEADVDDSGLEADYIDTLVGAAINLTERDWEDEDLSEPVVKKAIELLRKQFRIDPNSWAMDLIAAMEAYDDAFVL